MLRSHGDLLIISGYNCIISHSFKLANIHETLTVDRQIMEYTVWFILNTIHDEN